MITRPLGGRDVAIMGLLVALLCGFLAATNPWLALAALAGTIFVSWVVARAELVLMVMIAALPWEAMLRYPSESLSVVKLLGLALVVAFLFRMLGQNQRIRTSPIIGIALAFALVIGLSLIVSPEPSAGLTKGFRYGFFVIFLFLVSQLVPDLETGKRLLRVYCVSAAVAGVVGLSAFLAGTTGRAAGPIEDPNDFGYLMATVVPLALYLYGEDRRLRPLWGTAFVLLLAATAATLSRGALLGLGALLIWAILTRRVGPKVILFTGSVGLAVGLLSIALWSPIINERLEEKNHIAGKNVESRKAFWSAATRMSFDRPLLGVGPGRFGVEAPAYVRNNPVPLHDPVVHDAYLEILAEDGPFALGLFLTMLVVSWGLLSGGERAARQRGSPEAMKFAAAIKGTLIVSTVSTIFLSEQIAAPIWIACALAASGAILRYQTSPEPRRTTRQILA
jgi:putative inorganic carbon (HCO3(-)) transporter